MGKGGSALLLATIAISMFLDGLDGTIVNVALPEIASYFGIGAGDTSWVITVYYLAMAGLILVFGRLCDMGALKRILIAGMSVFTIGSFLCGISPDFTILLASRAFQGVGAAMLAASAVMIGVKYLPREKLGIGMSLVVMGSSIGIALGPSVGAVLTDFFSWQWIFFINVPVGIVAVLLAHRAVPADKGFDRGDIDAIGSVMLFAAIVLGLYAIERIPSAGVTTVSIVALVACVVIFVLFLVYERGRPSPVLDLRLFRNRDFDEAMLAYTLVNVAIMGVVYLVPFFLRKVMGLTTFESGLVLSVQSISMIACCILVARTNGRVADRTYAVIACVILALFVGSLTFFDGGTPIWCIALAIFCGGSFWGIGGGPMGTRMVNSLEDGDRGSGSSMLTFVLYFSSALGTALFAGLFGLASGEGTGAIDTLPVDAFLEGFVFCAAIACIVAIVAMLMSWHMRFDVRRRE